MYYLWCSSGETDLTPRAKGREMIRVAYFRRLISMIRQSDCSTGAKIS